MLLSSLIATDQPGFTFLVIALVIFTYMYILPVVFCLLLAAYHFFIRHDLGDYWRSL